AAISAACSSLTEGHLEVFVLDDSGRIHHRWWWPDPNWSDWYQMPAPPAAARITAMAAGSHHDHHQELVAVAADGSVHHMWNWLAPDGASSWSDWHQMPTPT